MPFVYDDPTVLTDTQDPASDATPLIPEVVDPPAEAAAVARGDMPFPSVAYIKAPARRLRKREKDLAVRMKRILLERIEKFPEDNPLLVLMGFMNNPKVSVKVRAWCADRLIRVVMPREVNVNVNDAKEEFEDLAQNAAILTQDPRLRAALEAMAANRAELEAGSPKENEDENSSN